MLMTMGLMLLTVCILVWVLGTCACGDAPDFARSISSLVIWSVVQVETR